ncbi:MAG: Protein TusB [Methanomassiliicoccales archaeon PtaU1.Bin124]|nr:MAG: Protein TusB [Methanomassiliicoccales archaeon PtaU1.Bin124]
MASKLFLLMKSPHEFTGLGMMKNLAGQDRSAVILFEDAVYYAVDKKRGSELISAVKDVYVIADDLAAKGFEGKADSGFKVIDYPAAVDLIMEQFDQTITL